MGKSGHNMWKTILSEVTYVMLFNKHKRNGHNNQLATLSGVPCISINIHSLMAFLCRSSNNTSLQSLKYNSEGRLTDEYWQNGCSGLYSNWMLTLLSSAVCNQKVPICDDESFRQSIYPALQMMAAKNEAYSVRGFMSKFSRLCEKNHLKNKFHSTINKPLITTSRPIVPNTVKTTLQREYFTTTRKPIQVTTLSTRTPIKVVLKRKKIPPTTTSRPIRLTTVTQRPNSKSFFPNSVFHNENRRNGDIYLNEENESVRTTGTRTSSLIPVPSSTEVKSHNNNQHYIGLYMNQMDEITSNPAFVAYRIKELFDLPTVTKEEPRNSSPSTMLVRRQRWKVHMERKCMDHVNQGQAFVGDNLRDVVYERDLLNAVKISLDLRHLQNDNLGNVRHLLRNYIEVLLEILPQYEKLVTYLEYLRQYLIRSRSRRMFTVDNFIEAEIAFRRELKPFPIDKKSQQWIGCKDEGFPCALWQLFHYLTVEYAHRQKWNKGQKRFDVLNVVYRYIRKFYSRTSKSLFLRHFHHHKMPRMINSAIKYFDRDYYYDGDVSDEEKAALWLWEAHNSVNLGMYDLSRAK